MYDWLDEVAAERIVLDVVLKDHLQLPGVEIRNKGFAVVHFGAEESFRDASLASNIAFICSNSFL